MAKSKKAESLEREMSAVGRAFHEKFGNTSPVVNDMGCWIVETYPTYVIASYGDKYYQIGYSGEDIEFSPFAEWVEVEEKREWIAKKALVEAEFKRGARNSRRDQERLQMVHDYSVENGAICKDGKALTPDEILVHLGGEVKALGNGKVGGMLVRHSTENDPDLTDDYFDAKTEIYFPDALPVLYQHGMDSAVGKRVIGKGGAKRDDVGVWLEAQLNMRDEYEKAIYGMAEKGKLGWSSGAVAHLVEREPGENGKAYHIKSWFIGEASLTPTPAEPRNSVMPLKSWIPLEAAWPDNSETKKVEINKELNMPELTKEEVKAMLDEGNKTLIEQLDKKIEEKADASATKAVEAVLDKLPEVKAKMGAQITVEVDEADRPFKSIGENLKAIKTHQLEGSNAEQKFPRLKFLKATGASEGVPFDGGILLDPTLTSEIIKPMHEMGPFSQDVRRLPVGPNSNSGWINAVDETSRATGSRWGGIRGYRLAEAATKTASKPTFRRIQWELKKYAAVVVATDELLADAPMFSEIVRTGVAEELNFMLNDDIMNGVGLAGPQGFMNSGALITVTRTTGSKILGDDISAMWNRMDLRGRKTANWYIGNDSLPQLDNLFAVGSTAVLYPYASIGVDGIQRLYGRPVKVTEFNASLNTTGDIALFDPAQYLLWEKGGVESATSIHVYFLSDETAFRFVMRVDGSLTANTPLTPYKGSTTTSPAVVLGSAT